MKIDGENSRPEFGVVGEKGKWARCEGRRSAQAHVPGFWRESRSQKAEEISQGESLQL